MWGKCLAARYWKIRIVASPKGCDTASHLPEPIKEDVSAICPAPYGGQLCSRV
jgi:hypothetical protein